MTPPEWLARSAVLQVGWSIVLGWAMLLPHQAWGAPFRRLRHRDVTAAHVDWVVLALLELGASYLLSLRPVPHASLAAVLLVYGGWMNPVPYFLRAFGVNAFSFSGSAVDRFSAAVAASSVVAITLGWYAIVAVWI
jgi:hypothetical protein